MAPRPSPLFDRLRTPLALAALAAALAACSRPGDPSDPAYGGFFRGIENISDGTYDARIASREERVAALQARQARLMAERNALSRRIAEHENTLARLKHQLVVAKVRAGDRLDPATSARIEAALSARPEGQTDAERLANLQRTIAQTRELAERLASLAG